MRLIQLITLFTVIVISSCTNDELVVLSEREQNREQTFPHVDQALWPIFAKFEEEAAKRGISIDLAAQGIVGRIEEIEERHVAGRCNYHSQRPELVTIDQSFWTSAPGLLREMVVFHELGHCQLVRDHREQQDSEGRCLSIMASGTEGCQLEYVNSTRNAYLDELFDAQFAGDWF